MITTRGELINGIRLSLPVLPGTAAWGLVSDVAMVKAGLDVPKAIVMTLLMYAGSAQLACLPPTILVGLLALTGLRLFA